MSDIFKFELTNLNGEEMTELRRLRDIRFLRTEQRQIHLSNITDDFGNEIEPHQFEYDVTVEVIPSTPEQNSKVVRYLTSMTLSGKDHGEDRFSSEYKTLKRELGVLPATLGDAVHEFEQAIEETNFKVFSEDRIYHDK